MALGKRSWNFEDMTGRRFSSLVVVAEHRESARVKWVCQCDCGGQVIVQSADLKAGHTRSCGCLQREITIGRNKAMASHGECDKTPEYRSWIGMKSRCFNPNNKKFRIYGGAGITVCDKWRNSFSAFLADMGRRPSLKHSLDRYPDPAGNYEPSNCRWATSLEQRHNRRK